MMHRMNSQSLTRSATATGSRAAASANATRGLCSDNRRARACAAAAPRRVPLRVEGLFGFGKAAAPSAPVQPAAAAAVLVAAAADPEVELADIKGQFDRWNAALATLDPNKVASLYAPDGVLLPTVSNKVRTTKAEIVDYFTTFLKLKPQGVMNDSKVRLLAPDTGIHSGVYTFDVVKDGKPTKVQARFSFTYKKIDGEWLIVDHHSSGMPETTEDAELTAIASLFDKWNAALQTGDAKIVAALYGPEAVLLPTVSNNVRTSPQEIEDYFVNFLKLKPFGRIVESHIRKIASGLAIHSGVYAFSLQKDGKPTTVQARFSFTYKKFNGEYFIIDHHSSAMPEKEERLLAEIAAQFDRWNAALQTLDPKKVAALYAPEGVLLPTVSNKVRTTKAEIEDYFTAFLKLKPLGVIDAANVRILGPETAINSGVYTFSIDRAGVLEKVQARYSFTYTKAADGQWLILDHHSSGMPEPIATPEAVDAVAAGKVVVEEAVI